MVDVGVDHYGKEMKTAIKNLILGGEHDMKCQHKPQNTLLIQYDSENGLHFCGKNERCRFCGSRIKLKRRWLFVLLTVLLWCLPTLVPLIALLLFHVDLYSSWILFRWLAPIAALIYFFEGSLLFRWETDPFEEHTFEKTIDGLSVESKETHWTEHRGRS